MQHHRISDLVKALRSILPPQATRGFFIVGTDCFELRVEEPRDEYARSALTELKYKLNDQNAAIDFRTSEGSKISDEEQLMKCLVGALKRRKQSDDGCRQRLAKE